jgi:hypothetical protein
MKLCTFSYIVEAQNNMQCVCKLAHSFVSKFRLNELEWVKGGEEAREGEVLANYFRALCPQN